MALRVAGPQRGRKGVVRTEEGEKSIADSFIRRTLSLAAIRAQSHSLLGRLVLHFHAFSACVR